MHPTRLTVLFSLLTLLGITAVHADTLTWTREDVPFDENIMVNFEGTMTGITDVEIQVSGYGGGQLWGCMDLAGNGWDEYVRYRLDIDLGGRMYGDMMPYQQDYVLDLTADAETVPENGVVPLQLSFRRDPDYIPWSGCYYYTGSAPTVASLNITVTCETAVATDGGSWGSIKACYR